MAIPRKPKSSPALLPTSAPSPTAAIAEALAPSETVPEVLAAASVPETPAPDVASATTEKAAADFQAMVIGSTEKAMVDAKAAQERLRAAAEQGLEQTRAAYARIKAAAEEATSSLENSYAAATRAWSELNSKAIDVMKANANAHFDHVKAVIAAKSVPEVINLQTEHLKARIEAANEQMKDLATTAQKVAADAGAPIKAILSNRFAA